MPEKKKILFVITQGEWGGAQRYVHDLATSLTPHMIVLVAVGQPNGAPDLQKLLTAEVPSLGLRWLQRAISPFRDLLAIGELARLYRREQPDIIHLNSSKAGILGSIASYFFARAQVVYTAHGWAFNEPLSGITRRLYLFLEKRTSKRKAAIITLSEEDTDTARILLNIPSKRLHHIPLCISPPVFLSKNEARKIIFQNKTMMMSPTTHVIGTIASLYKTKGIDIFLTALSRLKEHTHTAWMACIIGDGPMRETLKKQADTLGLTDLVFFTGAIPDAARLLPAFDVYVQPSRKEGVPYSLLEARAAGLPIIATTVGGVASLLATTRNALLVPSGNTAALAAAIGAWPKKTAETTLTEPLMVMVQQTLALYRSLLSQ